MGPIEAKVVEARRERLYRLRVLPMPIQVMMREPVPSKPVEKDEEPIERMPLPTELSVTGRQTVRGIMRYVAHRFGLTEQEIASAIRDRRVAVPRHFVCHLARRLTLQSLPAIGRVIGNRDHSTVLNSLERARGMILDDPYYAALAEDMERDLTGGFDE